MKQQLFLLELNEINFNFLEAYVARGELPTFKSFFDRHGYSTTTSEAKYEDLEPWIQWVTAHTGRSLAEHGVFRLGDIVDHDIEQIWETLEAKGFRVGAISPMNAKCRTGAAAFFVPDPWTPTDIVGPAWVKRMYAAVAQAVNDNAQARLTAGSAVSLALGAARVARPQHYLQYARYATGSRQKPWQRALFLDLLLSDLFTHFVSKTRPDFATLFLNAGAHIQHHYMFSSPAYQGDLRNPDWYLRRGIDPLLDVYKLYDSILADIQHRFPAARVMLATGLHQDPHSELTYYWRLKDHAGFLAKTGMGFASVEPRMSRDFVVRCMDGEQASATARRLSDARTIDGIPLFEVDNRGTDLFVMLVYPHDIEDGLRFRIGNEEFDGLKDDVAFVAIKNGRHNGIGYFSDSASPASRRAAKMPLTELPSQILAAMNAA